MSPRRKKKSHGGRKRLRGAPSPILCFCAVWLLALLLCRFLSIRLGLLGGPTADAVVLLLGGASPLLPCLLLLLALGRGRSAARLALWLTPLSAYLASSAHFGGGGIVGDLSAALISLLFGRQAPRIALLLFLALRYLPRLLPPLWSRLRSRLETLRKDPVMFRFGKKKPTVVDTAKADVAVPVADESFSSLRARLEREESVELDLASEEARTVYPIETPAVELDIPLDGESPAFAATAEPLDEPDEAGTVEDTELGDVVSADLFFSRAGVSLCDGEKESLFAIRGLSHEAAVARAVDAPFAAPSVPGASAPRASLERAPAVTPTPVQVAPTPAPAPTSAPAFAPAPAPMPATPSVAIPVTPVAPAEAYAAEEEIDDEPAAPAAPAIPSSEAPASAIFAAGVVRTANLEGERISDAAAAHPISTFAAPTPASAPSAALPPYVYPPLSLLKPSETVAGSSDEEIRRNSESLLETLASFNVQASIRHVSRGPRITRYELIPKRGVRIRNITNLQDDISMNLATAGIRIEAPIPGLAAVGVEVPNRKSTAVRLRDMLDHESFRSAASKTTVCVGSDVTGEPVYGDIAKMPHALIAGATGMGKSVCINAILLSLLYKANPEEVKLILVDPKKVELNVYNGIPHLLVPVVVEPQKAAGALVWAVGEMERRFNMIETAGVRDIKGYNRIMREHPENGKPLPQIVIVIDELNDLMMSARDAVEDSICRIAQKARAAGIHL